MRAWSGSRRTCCLMAVSVATPVGVRVAMSWGLGIGATVAGLVARRRRVDVRALAGAACGRSRSRLPQRVLRPGRRHRADGLGRRARDRVPVDRVGRRRHVGAVVARRVARRGARRPADAGRRRARRLCRGTARRLRDRLSQPLLPASRAPERGRARVRDDAAQPQPDGGRAVSDADRAGAGRLRLRRRLVHRRPPGARPALAGGAPAGRVRAVRAYRGRAGQPVRLRRRERRPAARDAAPPVGSGRAAVLRAVARADAPVLGPRAGGVAVRRRSPRPIRVASRWARSKRSPCACSRRCTS